MSAFPFPRLILALCLALFAVSGGAADKKDAKKSDSPDYKGPYAANPYAGKTWEKDGFVRPEAKNGAFYQDGKPVFFVGTQVHHQYYSFQMGKVDKPGWDWLYNAIPDKSVLDKFGFNTFSCTMPEFEAWKMFAPSLNSGNIEKEFNAYRQGVGGLQVPLMIDSNISPYGIGKMSKLFPKDAVQWGAGNRTEVGAHFMEFSPESPLGAKVYEECWKLMAQVTLSAGGNAWIYELLNEPVYNSKSKGNRELFVARMKKKFGTIERLNETCLTEFKSFDEIASDAAIGKDIYIEWTKFLEDRFVEILAEGRKAIRSVDRRPNVYVGFQYLGNNFIDPFGPWSHGIDLYKVAQKMDALGSEGGISFSQKGVSPEDVQSLVALPISIGGVKTLLQEDMLRAMSPDKPVFNGEHYLQNPEKLGLNISVQDAVVSSLWNQMMHGVAATYVFKWESRSWENKTEEQWRKSAEKMGYCLLNPYAWNPEDLQAAFSRFRKEADLLQEVILPYPRRKADVAMLFSYPTRRMTGMKPGREQYNAILDAYASMLCSHYQFDMLFEEQLPEGRHKQYRALVLPGVEYVYPETLPELEKYVREGGVLICDRDALRADEHGHPLDSSRLFGLTRSAVPEKKVDLDFSIPQRDNADGVPVQASLRLSFQLGSAQALATARGSGEPFIACNRLGKGSVYCLAGSASDYSLGCVTSSLLSHAGIEKSCDLRDEKGGLLGNVELQVVDRGDVKVYYMLNGDGFTKKGRLQVMDAVKDGWLLFDPLEGEQLLAVDGSRQWSSSSLKEGAMVVLPPYARTVLMLAQRREGDALRPVSPEQLEARFREAEAKDVAWHKRKKDEKAQIEAARQYRVDKGKCFFVNLRPFMNMGFIDDEPGNGSGGWTDEGFEHSFPGLPAGRQEFLGVPYEIVNPADNNRASCIVLRSPKISAKMPLEVKGVPVGRKAKRLFLLHTSGWSSEGEQFRYVVRYEDGAASEIPVKGGDGVGDYFVGKDFPNARAAFRNKGGNCLYSYEWTNPSPDKTVKEIDVISANKTAIPIVIAITGEEP